MQGGKAHSIVSRESNSRDGGSQLNKKASNKKGSSVSKTGTTSSMKRQFFPPDSKDSTRLRSPKENQSTVPRRDLHLYSKEHDANKDTTS